MCVVTKKGVYRNYPCGHHLAELLSVTIQEEKQSSQFCGFLSGVHCMLVMDGLHRKNISTTVHRVDANRR